jgi:hypothetical protein
VPTSRPSSKATITAAANGSTRDSRKHPPAKAGPAGPRRTVDATPGKGTSRKATARKAAARTATAGTAVAGKAAAGKETAADRAAANTNRGSHRTPGRSQVVSLVSVRLPVVNARVPMLRLHPPEASAAQTRWVAQAVRANLPTTERMMYYGGLAALAAIGVLEWPVAAAVGAGVWVAARTSRRATPSDSRPGTRRLTATVDGASGPRG